MPHLISWRKPHPYIQGSDWCHLDGAGFDDKVQGAFTFFNKCLDSVKGDTFFSLELAAMDLGPLFAEIS